MKITLWRRPRRDGSRADNYSYKFTWRGQQILRATKFTAELSGTHEQARADARAVARAHLRALELGCVAQVEAFQNRAGAPCPTLADLKAALDAGAPGRLSPNSAHAAWLQLLNILRKARLDLPLTGSLTHPLTLLSADLLQRYAQAVLDVAAAEGATERRLKQMQRSANSTWSTARMLFSRRMRAYYAGGASVPASRGGASALASRPGGASVPASRGGASVPASQPRLTLPASIDAFCKTAPFDSKEAGRKRQYDIPPDHIIRATFENLDNVQRLENPNLYVAVCLALAFGLRKGEIIGARVRNITSRDGVRGFEVVENWVARRLRTVPKNGDQQPFIYAKNGRLAHLEPFLSGRDPDDYILTGPFASSRTEYTFRDVSRWMRRLGWGTQKTIHEFRAYAIAKVAKTEGIFEASKWARHSNVIITQNNYGHHCTQSTADVPLKLPEPPATFTPAIVPQPPGETNPVSPAASAS